MTGFEEERHLQALAKLKEWFRLVDEMQKLGHPNFGGAEGCPPCDAEHRLNTLFPPRTGLKLMEALIAHRYGGTGPDGRPHQGGCEAYRGGQCRWGCAEGRQVLIELVDAILGLEAKAQ